MVKRRFIRPITIIKDLKVIRLLRQNLSRKEVAYKLGINPWYVHDSLKRYRWFRTDFMFYEKHNLDKFNNPFKSTVKKRRKVPKRLVDFLRGRR